ncbi:MAG: cytochrome c [Deltaproteobacteria bacterium]|nr:cytochrome c [Deltaproteobacteria bacterium]
MRDAHRRPFALRLTILTAASLLGLGCRGDLSAEPPVHLNPNMDNQSRFDPQEPNPFFEDQRAMRPPVPGTVAIGELRENDHLHEGKVAGQFAPVLPMRLTRALLERGQDRFNIYCAPCHGMAGDGNGMVAIRGTKVGMVKVPTFHDARLRAFPVGQLYDVATNGVRTMPAYRAQIPTQERWAIAAYVRALQSSHHAPLADVPAEVVQQKGWTAPAGGAGGAPEEGKR